MGPLVLGAISDAYGLNVAMLLAPLTSVFAGLLFLAAAAYYRRDLAKVDKVKVEMES
jgi:formate hydrogenlyase subunit 3/multisubunit Na+/H+ antiporter MnhD subunit